MDWFDPDTWKSIAAIADYWKTIAGAAVVIGGALVAALKLGSRPISWTLSKIKGGRKPALERPLRFVLDEPESFWSSTERQVGPNRRTAITQKSTLVHGRWYATNASDRELVIIKARVRDQVVVLRKPVEIPAHRMTNVTVEFTFFPAICKPDRVLIVDAVFSDNYGDDHRVQSVRFPYRRPPWEPETRRLSLFPWRDPE